MNMIRKLFTTSAILVLMLALIFGAVGAQVDPEDTAPVTETETTTTKLYTHPVIQIMSAYFASKAAPKTPVVVDEPVEGELPETDGEVDPVDEPDVEEPEEAGVTPEELAEEIARYHAEGMGFGVLVKLYAMAQASQEACAPTADSEIVAAAEEGEEGLPETDACTAVTVEELVSAFKDGSGMGQLFKEYGKPALLGVGHVKKANKNSDNEVVETPETEIGADDETTVDTQNEKGAKGKTKAKDNKPNNKAPKGKGPNK
jgi:hypothetical protein